MDWNILAETVKSLFSLKLLVSIVVIMLAIILYKLIMKLMDASEKRTAKSLLAKGKNRTIFKLLKNVIGSVILILTVLVILQVNGVNVSSLLAGVGIASAVIGLALQDWLKDIIRGTTILTDDYFDVGDVVNYQGREGVIVSLGLKTTKIKEIATGNIVSIANRQIESIAVAADVVYVKIPMPYEVKQEDAENAVKDVISIIEKSNIVTGVRYLGIAELADSRIDHLCELRCSAINKNQARREFNKAILEGLARNGISVPYNKLEVIGSNDRENF